MARRLVNTTKLTHEDWRLVRQNGVGGSDMGAIMGRNKYASALTVWLQKTGELPPAVENMYMKMGHMLEPIVANLFAEEYPELKVIRNNFLLQHDTIDCMLANIDRELVCPFRGRGVLEVKTASDWNKHLWTETSIPESYMIQVQHYLSVTGYRFAYVAVLIGGNDYRSYSIDRDEGLIGMIEEAAVDFWRMVTDNVPPPADGSESAREALEEMNRPEDASNELAVLPDALDEVLVELELIRVEEATIKVRKELLQQKVIEQMGNHLEATLGHYKVTWKPQSRTDIDRQILKTEHPEVYDAVCRTSHSRPFKLVRSKS